MKKAIAVFKSINSKNEDLIKFASGSIAILLGSISFFTKIFESKYNLIILFIGLFIVIQIICKELIKSKRESFGVITDSYSPNTRFAAKIAKYASWGLLIFPAFTFLHAIVPSNTNCTSTY